MENPETNPFFSQKVKISIAAAVIVGLSFVLYFFQMFYSANVKQNFTLKIRTGSNFESVMDTLKKYQVLYNEGNFRFVAKILKYPDLIKPGSYKIQKGLSNYEIVKKLRSGIQSTVTLRFESRRTLQDLAQVIVPQLEMNQEEFLGACQNEEFLRKHQLTKESVISIFIPNTYEVYWNVKPERLLEMFVKERNSFFEKRKVKHQKLGITPLEASILASIVEAETYQDSEKKRIAGVYWNRLKRKMRLQADPTVIFAIGDFSKTRVLKSDLQIDSPYNTYKHFGLPIGPINCPGIASLEAVLEPENHDYIFFCAKPDFSGYHSFSKDYSEHLKQAKAYQMALDNLQNR